jgi:hypothetical protein
MPLIQNFSVNFWFSLLIMLGRGHLELIGLLVSFIMQLFTVIEIFI